MGERDAAYLALGLRTSLRLGRALSVDVEALSWLPASVPDEPGRCNGGTRAGIAVRGALAQGILGLIQYSAGAGDCEPSHSLTVGATFAFGEHPLRKIPTPEQAGVQRLWLGLVDPVLDCNGWMLDDPSLLPLFKYGDPDPLHPTQIRRGEESFPVGEHFDIDRRGRLYRPHQYTALAGEQEFKPASVREKLALPVCETGPRHSFFERCKSLHESIHFLADLVRSDGNAGWPAVATQQVAFERECLAPDEQDDPQRMLAGVLAALGSRGLRPGLGIRTVQPPGPPAGARAGAPPDSLSHIAEHTPPPRSSSAGELEFHVVSKPSGQLRRATQINGETVEFKTAHE